MLFVHGPLTDQKKFEELYFTDAINDLKAKPTKYTWKINKITFKKGEETWQ